MTYIIGVDAGNTKTIALVARADGTIIGVGRAGCGDIYGAPTPDGTIPALEQAALAALADAGIRAAQLDAGAFSMAGADWPEDFVFIERAVRRYGLGRTITVVNDAMGALRAGSHDGTGVVVVCGTAAAIGARAADGRLWHTSFWQEPGGGGDLGRKTLRALLRAELGIDPPTALTARVLAFSNAPSVEELLHRLTAREGVPAELVPDQRHWARLLLDTAAAGDATARDIVEAHGASLGDYALAAARRVGLAGQPFTLVLAGGVLRHPARLLADALIARVREVSPGARPQASRFEPAVGALFMALELAGVLIDAELLVRVEASLPGAELFAT